MSIYVRIPIGTLRAITKQGETERAPYAGVRHSTEGSRWIVNCARRDAPRPLHILIWGGIEDLAQALHDAPDILELALPMGQDVPKRPEAVLAVENQKLTGHAPGDGTLRFRFCPKAAKSYGFKIQSNVPGLNRKTGGITATLPSPERALHPSAMVPNWWTDDPSPALAQGSHHGAKTLNRWREDYLYDFSQRMLRCQLPASVQTVK